MIWVSQDKNKNVDIEHFFQKTYKSEYFIAAFYIFNFTSINNILQIRL